MKKVILSFLLAICLMTTFLPTAVLAAYGDVTYRYCDENGANWAIGTKSVGEYKTVTGSDTVWTAGWYVVDSDITIGSEETPPPICTRRAIPQCSRLRPLSRIRSCRRLSRRC